MPRGLSLQNLTFWSLENDQIFPQHFTTFPDISSDSISLLLVKGGILGGTTIFNYSGLQVRAIEKDGEPWFVAKDVCDVLGYTNSRDAIRTHCKAQADVAIHDGSRWDAWRYFRI